MKRHVRQLWWTVGVALLLLVAGANVVVGAMPSEDGLTVVTRTNSVDLILTGITWSSGAALPVEGALLGVPTHEGLRVEVISAESLRTTLSAPMTDTKSQPVAQIGATGFMRDQPVVQIALNPVQINDNVATIYTDLYVRVSWNSAARAATLRPHHPDYEQVIAHALDNYADLNRPAPIRETFRESHTEGSRIATFPKHETSNDAPPALRLTIEAAGLYEIDAAMLEAAGWNMAEIAFANIQLSHRGEPVPLIADGDKLRFYGEAYEDLYVAENVYWLTVLDQNGLRMGERDGTPAGATAATSYTDTIHLERNSWYVTNLTQAEPEEDLWFDGKRLQPGESRTLTMTLDHLATEPSSATLRLHAKGHTAADHVGRVSVNGTAIGDVQWNGFVPVTGSLPFDNALLVNGVNTITVEAIASGDALTMWYLNWVEIDYADQFVAEGDELVFGAAENQTIPITGFTTNEITLLDITDPYMPQRITTAARVGLSFDAEAEHRYLATTVVRTPTNTVADTPSNLRDSANGADWIIISHSAFITAAQRLADYRVGQGLRTSVVDVQDVYDEFEDGFFNPEAIRNFLAHTYHNWQAPAPTYVVLLGDGSQEFKTAHGKSHNWIPPRLIHTFDFGRIPSDNYYVTFIGDDPLAEMQIGRLSAETLEMAEGIVDNLISAESQPPIPNPTALFVADDDQQFETVSDSLIDLLPVSYTVKPLYTRQYTQPVLTRDITETLNAGTLLVNYSGHGNHYRWGSYFGGRILTEDQTDALAGNNSFPFVTIANCLNGLFSFPYSYEFFPANQSLAEALQRQQNGGAIAVWADAGLGYNSGQKTMLGGVYRAFFEKDVHGLGAATEMGKLDLYTQSTFWQQTLRTMILFGDPASTLNIAQAPNAVTLESFTAETTGDGTVMLDWVTSAEFNHAGFNVYRTETAQFVNNGALNTNVIPSGGIQGQGGMYEFEDTTVESGNWYYWLEDIDIFDKRTLHGPVELNMTTPTAVSVSDAGSKTRGVSLLLISQIALIGLTGLYLRACRRQQS